jgi:hypothetical protein
MNGTYIGLAVLGAFFLLALYLLMRGESKVSRRDESARDPIFVPGQAHANKRFP